MESVAGIFSTRESAAKAAGEIRTLVPEKRIVLLTPHTTSEEAEAAIRTTDAESTGIGAALGGTVGGALGAASGATLGAAAASLLVPGVGPVMAAGILGAAVLGIGGAATGAALGDVAEEGLDEGLPHDELFIYEEALRRGRSVVVAFPSDDDLADQVRSAFARNGAESIDAAREDWWLGLRDSEEEYCRAQGREFHTDEVSYRRGFEAALNAKFRGKSFEAAAPDLQEFFADAGTDEAFRLGYQRGLEYQKRCEASTTKVTRATG
jgi:hypothetical protein